MPTPRITLNNVNAAIAAEGGSEKLVRGKDYFYFVDGDASSWYSASEYVYRLDSHTVAEWVAVWRDLRKTLMGGVARVAA